MSEEEFGAVVSELGIRSLAVDDPCVFSRFSGYAESNEEGVLRHMVYVPCGCVFVEKFDGRG